MLVGFVLAVVIISGLTIALNSHVESKMIPISGATLVPTGVNNTLNITFSDVTYSTVAPAFEFERGSYSQNAMWNNSHGNVDVTNATYLVMQNNGTNSAFSQVQYNVTSFNKKSDYFFMETKIASNLSADLTGISVVLSDKSVSNSFISSAKGTSTGTVVINIASSGYVNLNANESAVLTSSTAEVNASSKDIAMSALNFYDLTVYVSKDTSTTNNVTISLIDPSNGKVMGTASLYDLSGVNYTKLDYTAFQYSGTGNSAMILDWGYFVFASPSASAVASNSVMPYVAGAGSNVMSNLNIAPFDPSSIADETYKQAPNSTAVNENTGASINDFNNKTILSNNISSLQSIGAYNITSKTNFGVGTNYTANSTAMVANLTLLNETSTSVTADIHVSVFNSSGINTAVMNFLKNYTAVQATIATGTLYTWKDMSIISYMVSNIQTVTNLSASDASSLRDYFDNSFASVLQDTNMSLIDTNTSAIVAGAFAGDFYYQGMAYVPIIHGDHITDPAPNGQTYTSLASAGFAVGAYISGGAVIVPQYSIVGFSAGIPVFVSTGFSLGSIFGSLSSAGKSVLNYLHKGVTDISGAITSGASAVAKSASNYIIKPIGHGASTIVKNIGTFKSDVSKLANSVTPVIGMVANNVEKHLKGALGPISGAVSDLSSSLASAKNGLVSAVAAGASGLRTNILSIGTKIGNATHAIVNTLGKTVSDTKGVLSSMFTAVKTLPQKVTSGLASVATTLKNDTLGAINTVGSYITKSNKLEMNALGSIGAKISGGLGFISKGAKSVFSDIVAFGGKLGYVLEIVGITIAVMVIVGLILYFGVYSRRKMIPGEGVI